MGVCEQYEQRFNKVPLVYDAQHVIPSYPQWASVRVLLILLTFDF